METEFISCPVCGASMNHHANKLVYGGEDGNDSKMAEVLEEFHRCPGCGAGVSRPGAFDIRS